MNKLEQLKLPEGTTISVVLPNGAKKTVDKLPSAGRIQINVKKGHSKAK